MVRAAAPKLAEHTTDVSDQGVDNGPATAVAELPTTPTKKPRKKAAGEAVAVEQAAAETTTIPVEEVAAVEVAPTTTITITTNPDVDAILAELRALESEVAEAERCWDAAKREAKEAHEYFDSKVADLRRAIQALSNDEARPLLKAAETGAAPPSFTVVEGAAFDWRAAPVGDLKLPAKLVEKLADNSITTVGELEDVRANPGLSSIKGVGPAKVTLIEDAVLAWLSIHRDGGVLAAAATGEPTPTVDPARHDEPSPTDEEPETPEQRAHVDQVLARLDEIEAAPDYDASFRPESPSAMWTAGYQYYLDFESHGPEYCPHPQGSNQDEWLRGWLYNDYLCEGGKDGAA